MGIFRLRKLKSRKIPTKLILAMENQLKWNLRRCAEAYAAARNIGIPTVGRLAAGDWRFFERVEDGEKSFTARKYDEVMGWFSKNWPDQVDWPSDVIRPPSEPAREAL